MLLENNKIVFLLQINFANVFSQSYRIKSLYEDVKEDYWCSLEYKTIINCELQIHIFSLFIIMINF